MSEKTFQEFEAERARAGDPMRTIESFVARAQAAQKAADRVIRDAVESIPTSAVNQNQSRHGGANNERSTEKDITSKSVVGDRAAPEQRKAGAAAAVLKTSNLKPHPAAAGSISISISSTSNFTRGSTEGERRENFKPQTPNSKPRALNPTRFLCRSEVRNFLLEHTRKMRAHKYSRVSEETLREINEQVRSLLILRVSRLPSKGKTI